MYVKGFKNDFTFLICDVNMDFLYGRTKNTFS